MEYEHQQQNLTTQCLFLIGIVPRIGYGDASTSEARIAYPIAVVDPIKNMISAIRPLEHKHPREM